MDTRQQIAAAPKAAAPLVDTRTIGEAPTFTGEHKDWPEWSFQFTAYMGSSNHKSIEALRWAAMADGKIAAAAVLQQSFEEHKAQLYLALALLCKGSALVTVKNTEVNNGREAWRGLNATYDSNNKGRQRARMQYLLQPKRAESIPQTTEAAERCECDVREYDQRFGKTLDEDVKMGVILASAPLQVQNHCHLNSHIQRSYAQVRTKLFDCCRAQADTAAGDAVPMDLSMLGKGGKGKKGKGDKKGKGKGKGKQGESNRDEKDKDEDKKGKGKGKNNVKTEYFAGYCLQCKGWGHMKKDCW